MNSRDRAHDEDRRALAALERQPWLIVALVLALSLGGPALVVSVITNHSNDRLSQISQQAKDAADKASAAASAARVLAQSQCGLDKAAAEAPLSNPSSPLGIAISAGARNGYTTAECTLGPLTPADPQILPYLLPGVH